MTDEQIEAVLAVAECKSINKAAEKLFITQPALKKRLDTLENEFGFSIFVRSNSGCVLTKPGEIFYEGIVPVYAEYKRIIAQAKEATHPSVLRVCHTSGLIHSGIERLLSDFFHRFPQITRERVFAEPTAWPGLALENKADLFFSPGSERSIAAWREKGLCVIDAGVGSLICVTAADHPLAQKERVSLEDLKPYEVYTDAQLFYNTGLHERAMADGLIIQANAATFSRYDIMDLCEKGYVFIHGSGFIDEIKSLNTPARYIDNFPYRRCIILRNNSEETLRLLKVFIDERLRTRGGVKKLPKSV